MADLILWVPVCGARKDEVPTLLGLILHYPLPYTDSEIRFPVRISRR